MLPCSTSMTEYSRSKYRETVLAGTKIVPFRWMAPG